MQKNAGINKGAAGTDVIKAGNTVENGARNCGEDKPQKAKQEKVFQIKGCEPSNFVKCDVADKEIHVISTPTATPDVAQSNAQCNAQCNAWCDIGLTPPCERCEDKRY